jgi:phosphatidylinositol glycan class B
MPKSSLFFKLVAFRILNACLVQTFFQPDEFFQSLEVAHRIVFGYGWQTWEWRDTAAIRSPLHALLFVPGYAIVKAIGLEDTYALVHPTPPSPSSKAESPVLDPGTKDTSRCDCGCD